MVWNDMQWYSYSLPFLLMQTFWMDTHWMDPYWWDTCWTDMYWWDMYWWDTFAIPADAHLLNGYALNGYASHGYVLVGYVLKEKVLVGYVLVGYALNGYVCKTDANLLNGYALNGYVLVGYVLNGYVLVGYVLNGYVWDMCDVLDMCGICVVWDTPTIFWRTLQRNVFREKHHHRAFWIICHYLNLLRQNHLQFPILSWTRSVCFQGAIDLWSWRVSANTTLSGVNSHTWAGNCACQGFKGVLMDPWEKPDKNY